MTGGLKHNLASVCTSKEMASSICHIACVMQCSGTPHCGIQASTCNETHASTINADTCMYRYMYITFKSTIKLCVLQIAHVGVCVWYNAGVSRICLCNVHSVACRGIGAYM